MPDSNILSDFGINILEEEIDDVIFQTNEFLTDATFTGQNGPFFWILTDLYGSCCPFCTHHGCWYGL
jgi:hypothetical protein